MRAHYASTSLKKCSSSKLVPNVYFIYLILRQLKRGKSLQTCCFILGYANTRERFLSLNYHPVWFSVRSFALRANHASTNVKTFLSSKTTIAPNVYFIYLIICRLKLGKSLKTCCVILGYVNTKKLFLLLNYHSVWFTAGSFQWTFKKCLWDPIKSGPSLDKRVQSRPSLTLYSLRSKYEFSFVAPIHFLQK